MVRDDRRFVCLRMGAQTDAGLVQKTGHRIEIELQRVEIEEQRRALSISSMPMPGTAGGGCNMARPFS
jgi:hypothetical protein